MINFLIPGYYLFYSRLKRKSELVSLLIVYPVFLLIFIGFQLNNFSWWYLPFFLVSLFTWLSFYEVGYLENDAITIKKEKNPTLRIRPNEIEFIQTKFYKIQLLKILLGCFGLFLVFLYNEWDNLGLSILGFLAIIIVARTSFYFHNTLRSRWNILTYFVLSTAKYTSLVILFLWKFDIQFLLIGLLFIFPIPRTLEHACKVKYVCLS